MDMSLRIGANFELGHGVVERVLNPRTGAAIAEVAEASPEQVTRAVEAAGEAFGAWSRTTPAERSLMLLKLADLIERDAEAYADLEALSEAAASRNRYEFMLTVNPLALPNATGSPVNPIAMF